MALAVLLQTSRVSAEATVAHLQALEIDAQVLDRPNVWTKLASGGNYRVRVTVPEEELERARSELRRLEAEAAPRVRSLAQEVQLVLGGALLAALLLTGVLFALRVRLAPAWAAGLWLTWLVAWVVRSRRRASPGP